LQVAWLVVVEVLVGVLVQHVDLVLMLLWGLYLPWRRMSSGLCSTARIVGNPLLLDGHLNFTSWNYSVRKAGEAPACSEAEYQAGYALLFVSSGQLIFAFKLPLILPWSESCFLLMLCVWHRISLNLKTLNPLGFHFSYTWSSSCHLYLSRHGSGNCSLDLVPTSQGSKFSQMVIINRRKIKDFEKASWW
jgi:hypothetical protein